MNDSGSGFRAWLVPATAALSALVAAGLYLSADTLPPGNALSSTPDELLTPEVGVPRVALPAHDSRTVIAPSETGATAGKSLPDPNSPVVPRNRGALRHRTLPACKPIAELFRDSVSHDFSIRLAAARALAARDDDRAMISIGAELMDRFSERTALERVERIQYLTRLRHPVVLDFAKPGLVDNVTAVRLKAIDAVWATGLPSGSEMLQPLLKDSRPAVQRRAAAAIARLGRPIPR